MDHYGHAASDLVANVGDDPSTYDAQSLRQFVLDQSQRQSHGATKTLISGLQGVSLFDIGAVLRHHSPLDMTATYAKVDVELLKQVAQPWPEEVP